MWFLIGAGASVLCVSMLWRTALDLRVGNTRRAVWRVWSGALVRMSLMVGVLWLAVRVSAVSAVLAAAGFLLARTVATAWFMARMTGSGGLEFRRV
jgi:hypothetical protein